MKKRLLLLPLVAVVLILALVLVLRSALPPARLRSLVEPRLEAALGRDVDIGDVRLRLVPLAARLDNLRVHANSGFTSPHVLEMGAVQLELAFLPLLQRRIEVQSLLLDAPHVVLEQDSTGQWNFAGAPRPAAAAPAPSASGRAPVALAIRKLTVRAGTLEWRSAIRQLEIRAPLTAELALRLDRDRRDARVDGWIESPALAVRGALGTLPPVAVRLEPVLRADLADSSATVESLQLRLQDFVVTMEGNAALRHGRPLVQLRTRAQPFDLAALLALLPRERLPQLAGIDVAGTAQLDVRLDVPASGPPRLDGTLALAAGRLHSPQWPAAIESLQGRAAIHGDSLVVETLDAMVAGAPFHVEGQLLALGTPSRATYDLGIRSRIDLATVTALLASLAEKPSPVRVQGTLDADVRARGALVGKSIPALQGPIALEAVRLEAPQLRQPLQVQGRLRGDGSVIQIESLALANGDSRLTATGTLRPALPPQLPTLVLRGQAAWLDVDTLLVPAAPPASAGGTAAEAAARTLVPALPPLQLDAEITATSARAQQTTLRDAVLRVQSDAKTFHLTLQAATLARDALALADCRAELAGTPAASRGRLQARSGQLAKVHATDLQGDLRVAGTTVELAPLSARTYDGKLEGSLRLDLADPSTPRQELALQLQAVQLAGLMQDFFRAGAFVEGTLRGSSAWKTAGSGGPAIRANLTGQGTGLAVDGRLRQQPLLTQLGEVLGLSRLSTLQYRELGFSFEVAAGQVRFPELQLRGPDADATVQGSIGLDGGLDLLLSLQLSPALTQQALRGQAVRGLGGLFTDSQGRLVLDFTVGGDLRAPKLRADLQRTAGRSGLRALGEKELQRLLGTLGVPETKSADALGRAIGGAVRGLLGPKSTPRDSTPAPPRDSTAAVARDSLP